MPSSLSGDDAVRQTLAKLQSLIAKKESEVMAMRDEVKAKEAELKEAVGRLDELAEELTELREVYSSIDPQPGKGVPEQESNQESPRAAPSTFHAASGPQMDLDVPEQEPNQESRGAGPSTDRADIDPQMGKDVPEQEPNQQSPGTAPCTDSAPNRSSWQEASAPGMIVLGHPEGERGGFRSHLEDDGGDAGRISRDDAGTETPVLPSAGGRRRSGGYEYHERLDTEDDGSAQGHAQGTDAVAGTFTLPGTVDDPSSGDEEREHEAQPVLTDGGRGRPTSTRGSKAEAESCQVFVGNIDFSVGEEQLQQLFCTCGEVVRVKLLTDRETGTSKGKAFVTFADDDSVEAALKLERQVHWGRKLYVSRVGDAYKDKSRQDLLERQAEKQRKHQEYLERQASREQRHAEYLERQARRERKQQEFEARQHARFEREMARSQRQQEAIWRKQDAGMYHKVWPKGC